MVCEIISECIKMSDETYREYKAKMISMFSKQEKTRIMDFWNKVFVLIESYRNKKREEHDGAK